MNDAFSADSLKPASLAFPEPHGECLSTVTPDYQADFRLRRAVSTMAMVASDQLCCRARQWALEAAREGRPFRILSVGCGDGDLDMSVLRALDGVADVEYLGLEVNRVSAGIFQDAVNQWRADTRLATRLNLEIRIESADGRPQAHAAYDLVLMSHVLYYFSDPVSLIRDYLHHACRIDGRLLIIHSGRDGIPQLMDSVPGLQAFLSAEDIRDALEVRDLRVDIEFIDTELDATEIVAQTANGQRVLGFCVERDPGSLSTETTMHLLKAFWSRCSIQNGRARLRESLAFMVLRNDLGWSSPRMLDPRDKACDPIEDYHRLATSFNWNERLQTRKAHNLRILDVGCGRGRWLKALHHHWPELASRRTAIEYYAVDPSEDAIAGARHSVSTWGTWIRAWPSTIEKIVDLPMAHFDIVWSIHSLYCVPHRDLQPVLTKLVQALRPDGLGVIAMPDLDSFYIAARPRLSDQPRFTCAEDVCCALRALNIAFEVRKVSYGERISVDDEAGLMNYVWRESIGNSFGSAEQAACPAADLPCDDWFLSHRRGDEFVFPQHIWVMTFRGGQSIRLPREQLNPSAEQMRSWSGAVSEIGIEEQLGLRMAPVIPDLPGNLPPRWVHGASESDDQSLVAQALYEEVMKESLPEWGEPDLRSLLRDQLLPLARHGTRDNAPGYMAYIPSGGLFLSAIADGLAALLNRYSSMFMAAPGLASIEVLCIRWLCEITGMRASAEQSGSEAGGLLLSGASMATVTAVHAARNKAISDGKDPSTLVAYFGDTAHSCIRQSLAICGITGHRAIAVGSDHRVDMSALSREIAADRDAGLNPFFIALTAGEVGTGAIDDINRGRDLASATGAWLHVDAAYGGFFILAPSAPAELGDLCKADSLCLDPHKGLGLPYGTGALLVKNLDDLRIAFSKDGAYLPGQSSRSLPPDLMDLGIEMTRPMRGLGVWLPIKLTGIAPFRDHLEQMLRLARWLAQEIRSIPELELVCEPCLSIVTFRLSPPATNDHNRALLDEINRDGRFFISGCELPADSGGYVLRVALLSFRTDSATVEALSGHIRESVGRLSRQ